MGCITASFSSFAASANPTMLSHLTSGLAVRIDPRMLSASARSSPEKCVGMACTPYPLCGTATVDQISKPGNSKTACCLTWAKLFNTETLYCLGAWRGCMHMHQTEQGCLVRTDAVPQTARTGSTGMYIYHLTHEGGCRIETRMSRQLAGDCRGTAYLADLPLEEVLGIRAVR